MTTLKTTLSTFVEPKGADIYMRYRTDGMMAAKNQNNNWQMILSSLCDFLRLIFSSDERSYV